MTQFVFPTLYDTHTNKVQTHGLNLFVSFLGKDNKKLYEMNKKTMVLSQNKDIVISDLCFIKFTKEVKLDIYTFDNVLVYERDNLI